MTMQRGSILGWGCFAFAGFAALIGCAVGTSDDPTEGETLTSLPVEAGEDDSSHISLPGSNDPDSGLPGDAGSGDAASPTTDGGADSGAPTTDLCKATNACGTGVTDLGSIAADEGGDVKTWSAAGSLWLKVLANEDDNSVIGAQMKTHFVLTQPAGTNFDLYVYRSGSTSNLECSAITQQSTNATGNQDIEMKWGEGGLVSNGSDDSALVTIEVRHVSGTCATATPWTLTVSGNQ